VVRARTAAVSGMPAMSKGARYETPTVSGANDAGKDVGRDGLIVAGALWALLTWFERDY